MPERSFCIRKKLLGRIAVYVRRTYMQMRPVVTDRVAWSVGLSVCHSSEPYKNGSTDRDAVWVEDSGAPKEPCIRLSRYPIKRAILRGKGRPIVKYMDTLP